MAVKVAIVATHPIQHFCPLYRALAKTGEIESTIERAEMLDRMGSYNRNFNSHDIDSRR